MIVTVTPNPSVDVTYWVDHLKIGKETQEEYLTRATDSDISAGGKGINISIFLAHMGLDNIAMGFVGGYTGHVVLRALRDEGVTTNFVWTESGETRTNLTILEHGREHIPILIDGPGVAVAESEMNRFMRRYRRMLKVADWVVLAGSLPPQANLAFYYELTELAKQAGAKVAISAGASCLTHCLPAAPNIVKPDIREHLSFEWMKLRTREEIISAGKRIVQGGVEMMIVSHEVIGDIVITPDSIWEISARVQTTQFRNLVGADDALLGGVIYQIYSGAGIEQALRFGLAAGILSAESREKVCGDIGQIEHEMANVSIKRI